MKKAGIIVALILLTVFSVNVLASAETPPWSKYPDNSSKIFKDADTFYNSIDKSLYTEYENAKLNIREKTTFKDINNVLARADKYGRSRTGGEGYHPNRQVYVFVSVSKDGKMKKAIFDAELERLISTSSDL
ncbi:hypothetical protein [Bacillus sp. EB01]|uniref:hypothetical protein n=1 Tax=Bacillus sp. EB01 TaxID=1347086 RepID=UPI0005C785AA|nr:hypothetical protein [Bacillus sp. EB01]